MKGSVMAGMNDGETTLQDVKDTIARFTAERDWQQFHSAKNVAMALVSEAAELMAHFRWSEHGQDAAVLGDAQSLREIRHEVADVLVAAGRVRQCRGNRHGPGRAGEDGDQRRALLGGKIAGNGAGSTIGCNGAACLTTRQGPNLRAAQPRPGRRAG